VIDLHSHILPGVDDGPRTLDESLGILRAAAEDGITRIAATPHVRADYPTSPETMEQASRR
jgi:Capsular polysaccharide biosynthesis protein